MMITLQTWSLNIHLGWDDFRCGFYSPAVTITKNMVVRKIQLYNYQDSF